MWNPLSVFFQKSVLGVDIGTSSIKIVEISTWGQAKTLENYGELKLENDSKSMMAAEKRSTDFIAKAINTIVKEAKIKTRNAVFSVPDFSTFCTSFEIPPMTDKEIPEAIYYNASRYLTMPLSEVMLDWKVVARGSEKDKKSSKVFLVVITKQVVQEFQTIANLSGLKLNAIEAEALSVSRALVQKSENPVCLVDIGVQSSTVNIIDNGFLQKSYSFNFNGSQISKAIAGMLGVDRQRISQVYHEREHLLARPDIAKTLSLLLDPLLIQIKNVSHEFFRSERKEVKELYLTGGASYLPGIKEYFVRSLPMNVSVPNCFSNFLYPVILEKSLREMSPRFSVAVGAALGGFDI